MRVFYNEFDHNAAEWLRELMASGLIPKGTVDERSITEINPAELGALLSSVTTSLELEGGPTPCDSLYWPDDREESGPLSCPCQPLSCAGLGKGHADERHLWPGFFTNTSPSAGLQRSLEKMLRARMDVNGSLEYVLTWKESDMPSGVPICALRASARPTSGSGFTGWRTPDNYPRTAYSDPMKALARINSGHQVNLQEQVVIAGWVTPSSRDWKDTPGMAASGTNPDGSHRQRLDQLPRQAQLISGRTTPSSLAPTENTRRVKRGIECLVAEGTRSSGAKRRSGRRGSSSYDGSASDAPERVWQFH